MKRSKITAMAMVLMIILLPLAGCSDKASDSQQRDIAEDLIVSLYEVPDYEMYEETQELIKSNPDNLEIAYKKYRDKYNKSITSDALNSLFSDGYAYYMDSKAYDNSFTVKVVKVSLNKSNNDSQISIYNYKVDMEFAANGKTINAQDTGIIQLESNDRNNYTIDYLKMDKAIDISSLVTSLR